MPSVGYYNQTAPFWDFVANLEEQGSSHPWFANRAAPAEGSDGERPNPWTEGFAGFPFGPFPYRNRHGRPHARRGPQSEADEKSGETAVEKESDPEEGPSETREQPQTDSENPEAAEGKKRGPGARRGGRCAGRGRGDAAGNARGACGKGAAAGWGRGGRSQGAARGRGGPHGFPMGRFGPLAGAFNQFLGPEATKNDNEDFKPEVDIFDTPESFVVHVSLPGAKKDDVGVNWDAEKSELAIAGVVHRLGDEELLKTLAMDERKVGAFERKVRLGSRANPANVDIDGITARMEDGVLRVDVPKLDSGYVEIKKVDIE